MSGIVAFHDIDDRYRAGITNISRRAFCDHLDWMLQRGCKFCGLDDLITGPASPQSVCVTMDDALESQITGALPELTAREIPAVVFVVTALTGQSPLWDYAAGGRRHADWSLLREWCSAGMNVGSHGATHRDLRKLSDSELERELTESKQLLEDRLGQPVDSIAYPFGRFDARVMSAADRAGYRFGLTTRPGLSYSQPLALPRVMVSRLDTPLALQLRRSPSVWGTLERGKQHVVRAWAGGTIRYQELRGDYADSVPNKSRSETLRGEAP